MEIRAVRDSELEEMVNVQSLIFGPAPYENNIRSIDEYRSYVEGDSDYHLKHTLVVIVDKKIVGRLRIWDREMRIGSSTVRVGGIGGVGTHPDHRRAGYASWLMKEAIQHMQSDGYEISALFSSNAQPFYRPLGYERVPTQGVRIVPRKPVNTAKTDWKIKTFNKERDLGQVSTLYDLYNSERNGSVLRSRSHWDTTTARLRGTLPALVARRNDALAGYLSCVAEGNVMRVDEVAYDHLDPSILVALTHHFLSVCEDKQIQEIHCEIPHRHPLIDQLVDGCDGDLHITGNSNMMVHIVNLQRFLRKLLPDWQCRLNAAHRKFSTISIGIDLNDQYCVLHLDNSGKLQILDNDPQAHQLELRDSLLWRVCVGESSWSQITPILAVQGVKIPPEISQLFSTLFVQQEVIFWTPDHF